MPPADYKTFRMRGIPAGTTPEKLQTLVAEAVSCKDASAVRVRSLAVDASRPREMVATVTFESIPEKLLDECGDWTIEAPRDITLVIDTHFHGCTTLHCPPADQWKSDLIAISGLNGHAFGSFKKKNSSYMWLCDSLPKDFPGCRIIIYGYDTRLQDSRSFQSLLDIGKKFQTAIRQVRQNARKPLIFLGHSLGGIVAKEAISLMQESSIDADRLTFRAIRGIIFFGVPNQGMDIRSLIPMVGDQANRGFLHTLDHNSPVLRTQARDFSAAISHIRCEILNFYETQESPTAHQNEDGTWSMSGPPAVLVDTHSATHGRPDDSQGHRVSPIDCDHSNLIKFGSAYDEPYGTVTSFLQEISSHKAAQKVPMIKTEQACYQSLGFCEQYHRMDSLEPSPGTCDWLIAHELFIEWLQSSKGLLWIRGKPGSGKSMVMKHALNHIKDSTSGIVASFFIHGQGTQLQKTILGIYRSLMHQLFPYSPESFSSLTAKFEEYSGQAGPGAQDEKWSWMEGEIRHHFREGLQKLCRKSRVVVFVDALDEAGEQQARAIFKDFDTLIGSLGDDSTCQLSLCIACRHYPDISFKSAKTIIMEKFNSLDIKHVVNSRLDSEDIFEDSEKRHLKAEILEKSEGIFQWTSLVTETVILMRQKGDSFQAAKRNLDRVPRGLDHLYKAVLEPTDEHEHELKQRTKLFQWVALAAEPLTPLMLQHALALHSEMTYTLVREYQQSDGFVAEQDFETRIKTLSKGLIQLKGSFKNGRIEFIHQSIRDFLLGHGGLDTLSRLSGSASIELGHFEMSMSCLKYLFMDEIRHLITQSNPNPRVSKDGDWVARLPIIAYAWRNWIFHAVSSNELESDRDKGLLTARILDIFCWPDDQPIIELWNPVERIFGSTLSSWNRQFRPFLSLGSILEIPQWPCKNAKLVHLLALTGLLEESTQRTMSSDLEFLATPYPDALVTPLAYALHGQQKRTVQNLISAGIHVQYNTGRCGRSPLYLASLWGDPVIVSLLLDSGAKVNRRESRSWTALHAAAFIGNVAAVNILISAGAKVNYQAKSLTVNGRLHRGSPLHLAVSNGHHETVRKLISHGADLNLRCLGTKEPPLFSAIQRKSVDTIKLLLELGADIHIRDSMGNSPLHYALRYSHPLYYDMNPDPLLDIAALLIQFGCDVNTPDPGGITPLYESLSEGSIKLWDLLLGHGADPNARTPLGLTPLHVAVRCSTEATQALLHAGADVNVESRVLKKFMGFPIHLAVLSGNSTRVQLLLQAGSNVNIRNCERETPLRLALRSSSHDRVKVIKLLLDAGIDPKIVRSEIHATYSMPNVLGRLQLLLLAGMDPNIRDDEGETVLFWIVRSQKLARRKKEWEKREGVKMLLGCGADPSITNQIGRTAFTYAAMNGDYQVAKSLLRSGGPIGVWRQHSRFSFVRRKVDMLAGKSNRFFKRDRSWIPGAAEELVDLFEDMFDEEYYVWKRGVKFKLSTRVVYPSRTLLRTLSVKPKKLKHY